MVNRFRNSKIFSIIMLISLLIFFIGSTTSVASSEKRPEMPDGPKHSNQLIHLENNEDIKLDSVSKILIVTSGYGPLTGISPIDEKDYWVSIIQNMGFGTVDWIDGSPTITQLNQYDLVIYDAGGYWYPLSNEVDALWDYHFTGKPLIVIAPDINYDWNNIKATSKPTFIEEVLHIEGVLGILPDVSFEVIADTGHEIITSIATNQQIPVISQSSYPDTFDPCADGQSVLTQSFISQTEFGVGTLSSLPTYLPYDPEGTLFSVAAYPGSTTEGRTITFGFPPTALQDSASLDTLAKSTISWALSAKNIPITVYIEDAPSEVKVNKAPGDIIDIIELMENREQFSENVDMTLEIPSDVFGNPTKVFIRDSFTDTSESNTVTWTEPTGGVYSSSINLPSNTQKQIVWRFSIPETVSAQDNFKLTGKTYVNNLISSSDDALIKIVSTAEAIIVTNRKVLFDRYEDNDVYSLLSYLYEISDANSAGEKNCVVFYVDRYNSTIADWNQIVDYSNENSANVFANAIDTIIENKYDILSPSPQFLMIVGGDETIPFYRVNDANFDNAESQYTGPSNEPLLNMLHNNYFPTDNVYADMDTNWEMGNPELSTGRISAATIQDMRQLIQNGISGPSKNNNNAIVASRDGFNTDMIKLKLIEKNVDLLNDVENPVTIDNQDWTAGNLYSIMENNEFKYFIHSGHGSHNNLDPGFGPNHIELLSNDPIRTNKPFVSMGGCHTGLTTKGLDNLSNEYDNLPWAFIHHGSSGVLGSGSLMRYMPTYLLWAYGEKFYNEFYYYLIINSKTTRPVGEALKLAERNWIPQNLIPNSIDKKTVIQYILYGVPWMTIDTPISSTAQITTDYTITQAATDYAITQSTSKGILNNTYIKSITIEILNYDIMQIEDYDIVQIDGASFLISDLKPILPLIDKKLNLPINSNVIEVELITSASTSLGSLQIPSAITSTTNNPSSGFTDITDETGIFPTPIYTTHMLNLNDYNELNIVLSPIQFDTQTHETTLFNQIEIEITYETSNPILITELTLDKPAYNTGETIDTTTSIENVGVETITGMYLDYTLKDMVGQVLSSTISTSFNASMGTSEINTDLLMNGLSQGSYVLEVTAFDGTDTPKASTSTFVYISSGRISDFSITPNPVIPGDDITFEFSFENFAPLDVEANGAVHIYNDAGVEVANLPAIPIIVDANSMTTISVSWNTEGKDIEDYTALATITTTNGVFGPLFGAFKIGIIDCGDVNSDTEVNMLDVTKLFDHVTYSNPIPDEWAADVKCGPEDEPLNMLDVTKLFDHVTSDGIIPLECCL